MFAHGLALWGIICGIKSLFKGNILRELQLALGFGYSQLQGHPDLSTMPRSKKSSDNRKLRIDSRLLITVIIYPR